MPASSPNSGRRQLLRVIFACGVLVVVGCGSSRKHVDPMFPAQSYEHFERELENKKVRIDLGDGTQYVGKKLNIDEETTSWVDARTKTPGSVSTETVWRLRTTDHGAGAMRGLGIGILAGAGMGALVGLSDEDPGLAVPIGAVLLGAVGGILGIFVGSASGVSTEYEINPGLVLPEPAITEPLVEPSEGG